MVLVLAFSPGVWAQGLGNIEVPAPLQGGLLTQVSIELEGSTGSVERDDAIRRDAANAITLLPGGVFNPMLADAAVVRGRRLPGVRNARWDLRSTVNPEGLELTLTLELSGSAVRKQGVFQRGDDFPVLYQSDRTFFSATINGGSGFFSDANPWFGHPEAFTSRNPLVQEPALGAQTGSSATWTEQYVEYGVNGMTQLGESSFYAYGAVSGLTAFSAGRDIFRDDTRTTSGIEKAYGGVLYVDPRGRMSGTISVGRQNFTLNDGFLVAQYGSQYNAGPRPGVYLAPRTTHDKSILAQLSVGKWGFKAFRLDPNEYEPLESGTVLDGLNGRYSITPSFYWDVTLLRVPESRTRYSRPGLDPFTREGLQVAAVHARWADRERLPGVWLETEIVRQTHADFDMEAWGWYGTAGYLWREAEWTPSLSYRYASLDGDDPSTATYERYDGLFSGGLNEWLQGITINKALTNANRRTHRVRFNVSPKPGLNLTLDWFDHRAVELNNLGGNPAISTLASRDLGSELQFVARWPIARRLYFVGVLSHAMPGTAIKAATPDGKAKPWSSVQAQFYWNF